jgi:hypothetical protein
VAAQAAHLRGVAGPPSAAGRAFARAPVEAVVVAAAAGEPGARAWLEEGRHRTLAITGHDLRDAGLAGPSVGRGLAAARDAMLDGRAPDRESQLAVALGA